MLALSLSEFGRQWFEDIIETLIEWFQRGLVDGYNAITEDVFGTPLPETGGSFVFGEPTNDPWVGLHESLVTGEIMLLSLLLLVVFVQAHHTIRIFNFGSVYRARTARRSAWTGAILIAVWYWTAALALYLVDGFTLALIPDVTALVDAIVSFLQVSISNPALALLLAGIGGIAMWILQALFFIREILLYVYLYSMPIVIAVAFGYLPVISRIARQLALKFVPLAIMPLPVAILFRGYDFLFRAGADAAPIAPESSFLSYLVGASLPVFSLILVWKLFAYASPLTASVVGGITKGVITAGAAIGAAKVAGPMAAVTAARWGPKAATWQVAGRRLAGQQRSSEAQTRVPSSSDGSGGTAHDNVVTDAYGQQGVPEYRRTENDPGYY